MKVYPPFTRKLERIFPAILQGLLFHIYQGKRGTTMATFCGIS
jgi:hypothetical protein